MRAELPPPPEVAPFVALRSKLFTSGDEEAQAQRKILRRLDWREAVQK